MAPQAGAISQPGQPTMIYQPDPSMLQSQSMMNGYGSVEGPNPWNHAMSGSSTGPPRACPGCALCGAGTACPKRWYADSRLRIMNHPRPRKKVFGAWRNIGLNDLRQLDYLFTPATSSRSLAFGISSSYEITLGRYLGLDTYNRDHFLEFTFYGTNHWGTGASVRANNENEGYLDAAGNVVSSEDAWVTRGVFGNIYGGPNEAAGFNRASYQWSDYRASLNNFEVNLQIRPRARADRLVLHKNGKWQRQCAKGTFCNWMAGVRLFTMNENYQFHSTANIDYYNNAGAFLVAGESRASYRTRADNTLLGLQFGPDWTYRNCRAEFGMGVKAAAYINFAEQESWINISGAGSDFFSDGQNVDFNGTATANTVATSIEMDFHASYKVRPNLILKINYELLYMAGLALAPEQVDMGLDQSLRISTGGSLIFQSATLGAEYNW